jgi:hypothetical protein
LHNLTFEKLIFYDAGEKGITVDVKIQLSETSTIFPAKIDTGSEACIFRRVHGEKIGIEIENGEPQRFGTPTGSFLTYGHWVTLTVENFQIDSYVFFAADENFTRNVLGRRGWLDRMIVGINDYDGKLYLSRYESE